MIRIMRPKKMTTLRVDGNSTRRCKAPLKPRTRGLVSIVIKLALLSKKVRKTMALKSVHGMKLLEMVRCSIFLQSITSFYQQQRRVRLLVVG
jgi:hypothetical protein